MRSSPSDRQRPLRVLHILTRLNVGGPARQIVALARALEPSKFETHVITGVVEPGEIDLRDLSEDRIEAHEIGGLRRRISPLEDLQTFREFSRHIADIGPDVIHTHQAKAGVLGRMAAWRADVPATVHSFHGHLLYGGYFPRPMTRAVARIERTLAHRTTLLVTEGARVRDELLAAGIGSAEKYAVVPPGVALASSPTRSAARRTLGVPPHAPVIGFVGRLTGVKRPDRLIDVASEIRKHFPKLILLIAGGGRLLETTISAARRSGLDARFLGWRPDVEQIYAAADLILLTSDNEGMPYTLAEAAMAGTPAVTTNVGSASEVVVDGVTGFVTASDHRLLADAAVQLMRDRALLERMGVAAKNRADEVFSEARLAADLSRLYRQALGAARE